MEPIEEKLKQAMDRVDPPDGFVARVMARVETQPPVVSRSFGKSYSQWLERFWHLSARPVPAGALVVMVLVALGVGLGHWRRQTPPPISEQERIEGQKASAQLVLALEIAGARLSRMHALLSQPPPDGPIPGNKGAQPGFSQ